MTRTLTLSEADAQAKAASDDVLARIEGLRSERDAYRAALQRIHDLNEFTLEPRGMLFTAVRIAEEALASTPRSET